MSEERKTRKARFMRVKRPGMSISRLMAFAFLGIILTGTLLLDLPVASRDRQSAGLLTSLFTATSATCVTGLVLRDTWSQWSGFGQFVILAMIQIGGLGFMSAASLAYLTLRRRIGMRQQMVMAEAIGSDSMSNIVVHQKNLIFRALMVEGAGAVILTLRFLYEYPFAKALKLGVFHAVSAFCNAGFDILGFREPGASLALYHTDPVVCLTLSALVILGGLGFLVWDEILRERRPRRWSVYTRLVLITTAVLLLLAMVLTCILEWNNPATLGPLPFGEKLLAAFFQSMTLRTAGFAALDQSLLTEGGKAASMVLMLIGGSSGSTAGGLKTVTFIVLMLFIGARARNKSSVCVFKRTIPDSQVMDAMTIAFIMIGLAMFGGIFISATSPVGFTDALYESVSALATVGLTAGATGSLSIPAQILIIVYMYFGRVGVLTISLGFLMGDRAEERFRYAQTSLLIG